MVIQAILLGVAGLFAAIKPNDVSQYLDSVAATNAVTWLWTLIGLILIALSVHMSTTSRNASDPALRRAALVMVVLNAAVAYRVYSAGDTLTNGRWSSIGVLSFFAFLYAVTLPIKSIGIESDNVNS